MMGRTNAVVTMAVLCLLAGGEKSEAAVLDLGVLTAFNVPASDSESTELDITGTILTFTESSDIVNFSVPSATVNGAVVLDYRISDLINGSGPLPRGNATYQLIGVDQAPASAAFSLIEPGEQGITLTYSNLAAGSYSLEIGGLFLGSDINQTAQASVTGVLTPLPAAGWFLLSGIAGLAGLRRVRQQRNPQPA